MFYSARQQIYTSTAKDCVSSKFKFRICQNRKMKTNKNFHLQEIELYPMENVWKLVL